jgi:hypothetical protein
VFQALDVWCDTAKLKPAEAAKLRRDLRWFGKRLPVPRKVPERAIFWLRLEAGVHFHRLWGLVRALRAGGAQPRLLRTDSPGAIVYQDEFQIAAIPERVVDPGPDQSQSEGA